MVEVRRLAKHYPAPGPRPAFGPRRVLRAVDDASFRVARGETFGLVGESGSGKSTLARIVVGLEPPTAGEVLFDGAVVSGRAGGKARARARRRWQMIFQDPYASLNPRWRARDIVAEPIRAFGLAPTRRAARATAAERLVQVGLSADDGLKYPHEFSGGQRQRIAIARALASEPRFVVCDEPTSALDVSVQAQILNLMTDLQRRHGLTYLFISHDLAAISHVADRVGVMYLGRLCEDAPARELFRAPRHPYTRMLLQAVPDLDRGSRGREPPAGEPPDPLAPPAGCGFHPRCPFADERCRLERPEPVAAGAARVACHGVAEGRLPPP